MMKKALQAKKNFIIVIMIVLATIACTNMPSIPNIGLSIKTPVSEFQSSSPEFALSDCNDPVCAGLAPGTYWVKNPNRGCPFNDASYHPARWYYSDY